MELQSIWERKPIIKKNWKIYKATKLYQAFLIEKGTTEQKPEGKFLMYTNLFFVMELIFQTY